MGLSLVLLPAIAPIPAMAADPQAIVGDWEGSINPGAQPKKHILVHIAADQDGTLSGTIDYPDENASGIQITGITYKQPTLHLESTASQTVFDGTMDAGKSQITGTWKQGAAGLDLVLKRTR